MEVAWVNALIGGALIGVSVSLMLLWNGRVTGISGIAYGLLRKNSEDTLWRVYFIAGLIAGGLVLKFIRPEAFGSSSLSNDWTVLVAGILVGFGTVLGNGCTSGHGVCGISRLSPRSLVATLLFVGCGMLTVAVLRTLGIIS